MKYLVLLLIMFLTNHKLLAQAEMNADSIYTKVDMMPKMGKKDNALMKFIGKNLHYPKYAREHNEEGKVILRLTISKTGEISDVIVVQSVSPSLDREAIRVVKLMPAWNPAYVNGEPVNSYYTLPLVFKLQ